MLWLKVRREIISSCFIYQDSFDISHCLGWKNIRSLASQSAQSLLLILHPDVPKKTLYEALSGTIDGGCLPEICTLADLLALAYNRPLSPSGSFEFFLASSCLQEKRYSPQTVAQFVQFFHDSYRHGLYEHAYKKGYPLSDKVSAKEWLQILARFKKTLFNVYADHVYQVFEHAKAEGFQALSAYVKAKAVFFLGFSSLTRFERSLMRPMLQASDSTAFLFQSDCAPESQALFQASIAWIQRIAKKSHLCPFSKHDTSIPSKAYVLPNVIDEMHFILDCIKQAKEDNPKCRFSDMYILNTFTEHELSLFLSLAKKKDIPLSKPSQTLFVSTLLGKMILHWLAFICEPDAMSLLTCLSSPYVSTLTMAKTSYTIRLDIIEHSLANQSLIDLLSTSLHHLKKQADSHLELDELEHQLAIVRQLYARADEMNACMDFRHFIQSFFSFLADLSIEEEHFHSMEDKHYFEEFKQHCYAYISWIECTQNLGQMASILPCFKAWLQQLRFTNETATKEAVQWLSKQTYVCHRLPLLFMPKTTQQQWQQEKTDSIFSPATIRASLSWPVTEQYEQLNKQLFCRCLHQADVLVLSYSQGDVASSYLHSYQIEPIDVVIPRQDYTQKGEWLCPAVKSEASQRAMRQVLCKKTLSATQLECYQACPKAYFFRYLLGIDSIQLHSQDIASHVLGSLIHEIMQAYFSENKTFSKQGFIQKAKTMFNQYSDGGFFWSLVERQYLATEQGLLYDFADHWLDYIGQLKPVEVEKAFQFPLSDDSSHAIKGSIDMLLAYEHQYSVLDFKTGRTLPSISDVRDLTSLQLAIYMLAMFKSDVSVIGAHIVQLHKTSPIKHTVLACRQEAKKALYQLGRQRPYILVDEYFSRVKERLLTLSSALDQAYFDTDLATNPLPIPSEKKEALRKRICRYCSYKNICRFQDRFYG